MGEKPIEYESKTYEFWVKTHGEIFLFLRLFAKQPLKTLLATL